LTKKNPPVDDLREKSTEEWGVDRSYAKKGRHKKAHKTSGARNCANKKLGRKKVFVLTNVKA